MRVLTIGTFDLLHTGHRHIFARAAAYGELLVGVNSDRFVSRYKGRPTAEPEAVRMAKVERLDDVADVYLNDGPGHELIDELRPDLLVVGSDWVDRDYLGQIGCTRAELERIGCDLLFVARLPGYSTTALRCSLFTAIVVTHANPAGARRVVELLAAQTRPPDEIILVATETDPDALGELAGEHHNLTIDTILEVGDWGHAKRARGLELATGDWLGFFNDDDHYAPDYLEKMLTAAAGVDVVYCGWNENPGCDFEIYHSSAGNFIVSRELAQQVGWPTEKLPGDRVHPDGYLNDGHFIEALKSAGARVVKVNELLYWHNATEAAA